MREAQGAMTLQAVIFDLDGVIVSTDECHYRGWRRLAEEEGIPFTREDNHRQRGVSRMESLAVLLEKAPRVYSEAEKQEMAARKNGYYRDMLGNLSAADILPGAREVMDALRARGIRIAIGSSSRNAGLILERIGLADAFDAVADGNAITRSKPDPEVFQVAARKLGVPPEACLVVEDAAAGVAAARAAGMRCLAVGAAQDAPGADYRAPDLTTFSVVVPLG
jgi:beta-phosphoglucomutase